VGSDNQGRRHKHKQLSRVGNAAQAEQMISD
jgi:hypothetical protein